MIPMVMASIAPVTPPAPRPECDVRRRARPSPAARRRRQPLVKQSVERRAQLITLAGVAQVELACEAALRGLDSLGDQLCARAPFQLLEDVLGMLGGDLDQRSQLRADIIVHHVRAEE